MDTAAGTSGNRRDRSRAETTEPERAETTDPERAETTASGRAELRLPSDGEWR